MAVWAGHDCDHWDLFITLIMPRDQMQNILSVAGASLSERRGCYQTTWTIEMDACEFHLTSDQEDLGVLFKGGYHPIYFEHEWQLRPQWSKFTELFT